MFEDDSTVDNSEGATTSNDNDANVSASQDALENSSDSSVDNAENEGEKNQDSDGHKTIQEAIAAAIESGAENEGESPASKEDQEKKDADKVAADTARLDKNPRFQEVIAQRDLAQNELEEFKPVREAIKNSHLSNDDALETLKLGDSVNRALVGETDPVEVINQLVPIIQALQSAAGLLLPPDLHAAVGEGKLSKEYAHQLAKERAANMTMSNKAERDKKAKEANELRATNDHIEKVKANVLKATTDWEAKQQAMDPDYEPKRKLIYNAVTATVLARKQQGLITTAEDAVAISDAAYKEVSAILANALPKRQNVQRSMPGGAPSSKVVIKPATRKDAIMGVLSGS